MPASVDKPAVWERLAPELFLIYIGVTILILGWNLFSFYTPGWTANLGPQALWFITGIVVFAMGIGVWGGASAFRHHTRKLMAGNRMFQLPFDKPLTIESTYHPIDDTLARMVGEAEQDELKAAQETLPGANGQGRMVRVQALLPGGIDAFGFKSLEGGSQGLVLIYGDDQMIHLDQCVLIPYVLEARDHTQVLPNVLSLVERNSHFTRGKMPIYTVGDLDPGVDAWLRASPTAQSVMFRSVGYDGMVDRLIERANKLAEAKKLEYLPVRGKDGKMAIPAEVINALRVEMAAWLKVQPALKVAMGNANADAPFWRRLYYETLSQLNLADVRLLKKDNALLDSENAWEGRMRERSRAFGSSPQALAPGYAIASSRPSRSPNAEQ